MFVEANPRPFTLPPDRRSHRGRNRFRSLPFSSAVFLITDHCQLTTVHSSAVLPSPSLASGPQLLLLTKLRAPLNHAESTLLQVLILKQLKVPLESITFEKQGRGVVTMVNHLLETSHPLSSSALRPRVSVADSSSILRTHFQVPYPATPLFATLTKTPGVYGYSSRFGTRYSIVRDSTRPEVQDASTFGRSEMFLPTCNREHLPRVSSSKRVLAASLFLQGHRRARKEQDHFVSGAPVSFSEQGISGSNSTREKRRMPAAVPGIRGVKF